MKKYIFIAITGASGSCYAINLIENLKKIEEEQQIELIVCSTTVAKNVCLFETNINIKKLASDLNIKYFENDNIFAPTASGTFKTYATIIIPCSMGTMSRIANGISSNLIERTADVAIKEKSTLILSIRETPLNSIQLENLLKLSKIHNIYILPPMIAFYTKPKTIEDTILFHTGKIFDLLNIPHNFFKRWGC